MTRRAMEYIRSAGTRPWCLHLSFIKPHWPYIAPAPYNDMYGASHVIPVVRSGDEQRDPHPVYGAFMNLRVSKSFAHDEVRRTVVPVYMGLIKQIDDQMGVLFRFLEQRGLMDTTMIVLTSDHGDYLGDHWMGEKDLFHEPSVKVPLIVYDPSPEAKAARGSVCDELVESIDLIPTFLDWLGADAVAHAHRLEGRSLLPFLHGQLPATWRRFAFSEYDYSVSQAGVQLKVEPCDARLFMVADKTWKYVHAPGFRPMLFDLARDPNELVDLGASPAHADVRSRMRGALDDWGLRLSQRTTRSDAQLKGMRGRSQRKGVLIGVWDESDVPVELWSGYRGEGSGIPD